MGDYTNRLPNQNALDAVDELIAWMERRNYLNRSCYEFAGHRDHGSTLCPGDPLYGNFPHLSKLTCYFKLSGDPENIHIGMKSANIFGKKITGRIKRLFTKVIFLVKVLSI